MTAGQRDCGLHRFRDGGQLLVLVETGIICRIRESGEAR